MQCMAEGRSIVRETIQYYLYSTWETYFLRVNIKITSTNNSLNYSLRHYFIFSLIILAPKIDMGHVKYLFIKGTTVVFIT